MQTVAISQAQSVQAENFVEVQTVMEWLHTAKVLTETLRKVYASVEVHVLKQHMASFTRLEREITQMESGYVREVLLLGDKNPHVYARVAVPVPMYEMHKDSFLQLGNRPIGETLLYNREGVIRSTFQYSQSTVADLPFYKMSKKGLDKDHTRLLEKPLYTRSSTFYLNGALFLVVSETILPTIAHYPNSHYS